MTRQWAKPLAICVIIVEILALILLCCGLYIRVAAGNPAGSIYMLIAMFFIVGGAITLYIAQRKRMPIPKEELIQSERYTKKQGRGIENDHGTENPYR